MAMAMEHVPHRAGPGFVAVLEDLLDGLKRLLQFLIVPDMSRSGPGPQCAPPNQFRFKRHNAQ